MLGLKLLSSKGSQPALPSTAIGQQQALKGYKVGAEPGYIVEQKQTSTNNFK